MPGRDYNKAYALFEQSLGNTSYPVPSKPRTHDYHAPLTHHLHSRSFAERSRLAQESTSRPERPSVETHLLPPTPSSAETQDPSFGLANRLATPELTPDTRNGTPFTNLDAPTPGTTPPSLIGFSSNKPIRGPSRGSSGGDSFRTAQEQASPSDVESPLELPLQGIKKIDTEVSSRMEVYALGLKNFDKVTETAHRRMLGDLNLKRPSYEELDSRGSLEVLQRAESRSKRRKVGSAPKELTFLEDAGPTLLQSPTNQVSPSSWLDGSSTGNNSPTSALSSERDVNLNARLSTPESKIILSSSEGSPVVEASIFDSPQRRQRQLRHVSKNAELRSSRSSESAAPSTAAGPEQEAPPARHPARDSRAPLHEVDDAQNKQTQPIQPQPAIEQISDRDSTIQRTRSLLTSRMPASLRSKAHSWRRSAPGLAARESAGLIPWNPMGVVPEDRPLPESPRPPSDIAFGESKVATPRRGSEQSTAPSEGRFLEPGSARNTYARSSPVSDASEAVIRDAMEMSIYPHHNESLVVVENTGSSSNSNAASREAQAEQPHKDEPGVTDGEPVDGTPQKTESEPRPTADSPLTNPRPPPQPPLVSVIPPTPAKGGPLDAATSPIDSARRGSLSQRAKRYSDSLATSVSRLAHSNDKRASYPYGAIPYQPAVGSQNSSATGRGPDLHPLWKPRAPWATTNEATQATTRTVITGGSAALAEDPLGEASGAENIPPVIGPIGLSKKPRTLTIRRLFNSRRSHVSSSEDNTGESTTSLSPRTSGHLPIVTGPKSGVVNGMGSQRRGLAGGLRERLRERNIRKEEQRHQQRQERLRQSLGKPFFVEHNEIAAR